MKKLILSIALAIGMVAALPAHSQSYAQEVCGNIKTIAENVMLMRQLGAPESVVRSQLLAETNNRMVWRVTNALINEAYVRPRYANEHERSRASVDFAKEKHRQCLIAFGETS
jgi:hypothetical protein